MRVAVLGPVAILDERGSAAPLAPKERRLLAALAVDAGREVAGDRLALAVWGDDQPRTAAKTLQGMVFRLRRLLEGSPTVAIETAGSGYRLVAAPGGLDAAEAEALIAEARAHAARGDFAAAVERFACAEALWRGPSFGDLAAEEPALAEAARLDELRLGASEDRLAALVELGRHAEVVAELEAACAHHPLRERLWELRIVALYRAGRQADALRVYETVRRHLVDELGVEPSPALRRAHAAVLQHDPLLEPGRPAAPVHQCEPALRVVLADDAVLFREGVARILAEQGCAIAGQAGDAEELLRLVEVERPDVAVVDIRMPPSRTTEGLEAARRIRTQFPGVGVLVLSQYVESRHVADLLGGGSGGAGYLLKERVTAVEDLLDALRRVAAGGSVVDPEVVALLLRRSRSGAEPEAMTMRERDVLALMAEGRSNAAIAQRLCLTDKTVEAHVRSIFLKLGLQPAPDDNRRVLAVLAHLRSSQR